MSITSGRQEVSLSSGRLSVRPEGQGQAVLEVCSLAKDEQLQGFALLFETCPELRSIQVTEESLVGVQSLIHHLESGQAILWREAVMQCSEPWLLQPRPTFPHKQILTQAGYHPMRPAAQQGELYRRYIPELKQTLRLLGLDVESHLALFNQWQNSERVAAFWDQKGSLAEHKAYLLEQTANPKNQLLIVCLDDEPFAYIEAYWAKEDRIAPYYPVGDYDRGIHMLVGEEKHRGAHKVAAWLPSVCHYLYLNDPRTAKIVSEPRADNHKMIAYLQKYGFAKLKEFDFPHKRSALMYQLRDTFFTDCF
ncbi:GNAT family N-acetyltransferase [Marinomonas sp. THO17]|uniref:GNAT family N-acetyltransferase n=1 Tax=Marinomonas sp. THO17 TaxID=3149048 RepID=UPI00336C0072